MSELQVTPASQWRQGTVMQLPSGMVARLKQPDFLDMIASNGEIKDIFLALATQENPANQADQEGGALQNIAMLAEIAPLANQIMLAAFIDPRVVPSEDDIADPDKQIALSDLQTIDKMAVMGWALKDLSRIAPFPTQQAGTVATVQGGGSNRPKAKRPT